MAVGQPVLTVDENHVYRLGSKVLPGVTEVLQSVGIINTDWFTEESAWRGSVVHKCCELDDLGDLDESSVAEEAKGYLEAWRRFKREMNFNIMLIERPDLHDKDGYAGTPDRLVSFGLRAWPTEAAIIDLKTGAILPWVKYQLAAYSDLYISTFRRIALRLKPDGKYNVKEFPVHERRGDLQIFLAALAIHNAKGSQ